MIVLLKLKSTIAKTMIDHTIQKNQMIWSENDSYEVLEYLGRGGFGLVLKCRKNLTEEIVAVKMFRATPFFHKAGNQEAQILSKLSEDSIFQINMVRFYERFLFQNRICLVFEMLGQDLRQFLKHRDYNPLTLTAIRPILQQILSGLARLKQIGWIHTDIKPANIMMVDPVEEPYRVKIIDFGSALPVTNDRCNTILQTRFYRSPEIILGLPFSAAIDMWSLGCTAAELFIGTPLFPGTSEYDQIRLITTLRGCPSQAALKQGSKTLHFFVRDSNSTDSFWYLKSVDQYYNETGMVLRDHCLKSLDDIRKVHENVNLEGINLEAEREDRLVFVDLLSRMLTIPLEHLRITPVAAMFHPFMLMTHLNHPDCDYARRSMQMMEICKPSDHQRNLEDVNHNQSSSLFYHPPPSSMVDTDDMRANTI